MILQEFEIWLEQNIDRFNCKPYRSKRQRTGNSVGGVNESHLEWHFENIIPEISLYGNSQEIGVWVNLENVIKAGSGDLLADFMVDPKQNEEGKYYNGFHLEPYNSYDTLKEVYHEEFNSCFLPWINAAIREANFLAVEWNDGIVSAAIINPETQKEEFESYKVASPSREKEWKTSLLSLSIKNET